MSRRWNERRNAPRFLSKPRRRKRRESQMKTKKLLWGPTCCSIINVCQNIIVLCQLNANWYIKTRCVLSVLHQESRCGDPNEVTQLAVDLVNNYWVWEDMRGANNFVVVGRRVGLRMSRPRPHEYVFKFAFSFHWKRNGSIASTRSFNPSTRKR